MKQLKIVLILILLISISLLSLVSCTNRQGSAMETKESSIFRLSPIRNCRITADSVHVKAGAGESFRNIATLYRDDIVDVYGEIRDWYVIQLDNNQVGCIDSSKATPVVKENGRAPSPPTEQPAQPQQPTPPAQQPTGPQAGQPEQQPGRQRPTQPQNPPSQPDQPAGNLSSLEQQMVGMVNQERVKNDLAPYQIDAELTRVARIKAQDMVDSDYFSHYSPNYGSPFDMMDSFGIQYLAAGENLAANSTVQRAHSSLMNSSGHRQNILKPNFTHIGIGIKPSEKYGYIFVQMFISKPR